MRCLATIAYHQENFIKTLFFDKQRSLLVAGSNQGNIVVYDIGKPGRVMREYWEKLLREF